MGGGRFVERGSLDQSFNVQTLAITWPQGVLGQEGSLAVAAQVYGDVRRKHHDFQDP
jgi:hypothetical protein